MSDLSSSAFLRDYKCTFFQELGTKILKQGPIPKHVAIIMDGNRRYARDKNLSTVTDGHRKGEQKLLQVLNMTLSLGIQEVTFYSFAEDNFNRSSDEVNGIMDLTTERMQTVFDGRDELCERGVRWDVVGNWVKIPSPKLKNLFAKTCKVTKNNKALTVHLAFSYSSRTEMSEGVTNLLDGLLHGSLTVDNLNENLFQDSFTLHSMHPVDIVLRTGGDNRLSDFVLWQASSAQLEFIECTWPQMRYVDLLKILLRYQMQVMLGDFKEKSVPFSKFEFEKEENDKSNVSFIHNLRRLRWEWIEALI